MNGVRVVKTFQGVGVTDGGVWKGRAYEFFTRGMSGLPAAAAATLMDCSARTNGQRLR